MDGMPVTDLERQELGLSQGGNTAFYPLGQGGVFLDLHDANATVFYADHDYDRALSALDAALKRAYPKTKQIKDSAHPRKRNFRFRAYEVDLGNGKMALVEVDAPERSADKHKFVARVVSMARKN